MATDDAVTGTIPTAKKPNLLLDALRDAGMWGLITLLLTGPIVGLGTVASAGTYGFIQRWPLVFSMAAIVFITRFILMMTVWRHRNAPPRKLVADLPKSLDFLRTLFIPAFVLLAFAYPFLTVFLAGGMTPGRYWIDLGVLVLTYVLLGWGLNIVVGLAGLLDLGYVAFYAVGAYTFALLSMNYDLSFWVCLPLAGVIAAMFGVLLGFPVLRLRGDYLAIVTLAFGEIIRLVLINWRELTGGASGVNRIPRPSFFGLDFVPSGPTSFAQFFGIAHSPVHRLIFFYYVTLLLAFVVLLVTIRLRRLPIGRAWEALREDEIACRSLGISVVNTKLTAFALGATFGGFAGTVFAARQGYISPQDFTFLQSALVLAIVVLGGLGSNLGVVFSATVLVGGVELLRNLGFLKQIFGPEFDPTTYRMLIFGMLMVVIMVWRPRGLISSRSPSVFLAERTTVSAEMVHQGRG